METEILIFGVSHYDMIDDDKKRQRGAKVQFLSSTNLTNNHIGLSVPYAEIPYDELPEVVNVNFPAKFKARLNIGTAKKHGSKAEIPTVSFSGLKLIHSVEFVPVK